MLRITIELVPFGDESKKKVLSVGEIHNDSTGTKESGNYKIKLYKNNGSKQVWKTGSLEGFQRLKFGSWDLLCLALTATLSDRLIPALGRKSTNRKSS